MKKNRSALMSVLLACFLMLQTAEGLYPKAALADPSGNLLANPGFEQLAGGLPADWYIPVAQRTTTKAATEAAHSGTYGISIEANTSANPWIMQKVPVHEGALYEAAAMFKAVGTVSGNVGMKIEYYADEQGTVSLGGYPFKAPSAYLDGQWHEYKAETEAPAGAQYMFAYFRLYGTGKVYLDDASIVKKRDKPELTMRLDRLNYYVGQTSGHAKLEIVPDDGIFSARTVDVQAVSASGGSPFFSQTGLAASAAMDVAFDPSAMALGQPYKIKADFKDAAGQIRSSAEQTIYRWSRPSAMQANGNMTVGGEPFFPVIAYHAGVDDYPLLSEIGVNTVQGVRTSNAVQLQTMLDAAETHGLKVMVVLYFDASDKLGTIESVVTQFKSHPAVLTWMIMDEPTINGVAQESLLEVYRLVRSLDPVHPAYIVESDKAAYWSSAQATDVLTTDVYPYSLPVPVIDRVGDWIREADAATGGVKPVWTLLQTYRPLTDQPSVEQVRNMAYQSLLAGAKGIGYYALHDPGWELRQSDLWPGLAAFKDEMRLIANLTLEGTRTGIHIGDDVQWGTWLLGGETYAVAINVTKTDQTVVIPHGITGSRVERLYGDPVYGWGTWETELSAQLGPEESLVFRITPFVSDVENAIGESSAASALIANAQWQTYSSELGTALQDLKLKLGGTYPAAQAATDAAADIVSKLDSMQAWIDSQSNAALGGKRAELTQSVERIKNKIVPIASSMIRLDTWISPEQAAPGDPLVVNVRVSNAGTKPIQNAQLDISFPAAFQTANIRHSIGQMNGGANTAFAESVTIPLSVAAAVYDITAQLSYSYEGQSFVRKNVGQITVVPPFDAKLTPASIEAGSAGSYPFSVKLKNRSGRPLSLNLSYANAGPLTVTLPSTVNLAVYEEKTVLGTVYIPSVNTAGVYVPTIAAAADGRTWHSLPLTVKVEKNPVVNPGFEIQKPGTSLPEGWNLNNNTWDRAVSHGGQASVRMNPDPLNASNTILTNSASFVPVEAGKAYVLRGWVKNGSTAGAVSLGVRQLKAGNGTISYTWQAANPDTDWERVELPFTAAPNAVAIGIYGSMSQTANGYAWIDDLELREAASP